MVKKHVAWGRLSFVFIICAVIGTSPAHATPHQSTNYRFDESTLGAGGMDLSSSANYQASHSTGDVSVGNAASTNYQVQAGSKTTNDPTLSFSIPGGSTNLGDFTAGSATTATASFSVSNYTSYGYVVQIIGTSPSNGGYTLTPMTSTDVSIPGTVQFGINLVANTSPTSIGANPDNGDFGFGVAAANYATPNNYRYVSGETIAMAPKSSGITNYTISYLVNVAGLTPGGKYTSNQTIVVTGTY